MLITPLSIWFKGQTRTATWFQLRVVNDDLNSTATFLYELVELDGNDLPIEVLSFGNVTISGTDYNSWKSSSTSNTYAKEYVADQLNITLV